MKPIQLLTIFALILCYSNIYAKTITYAVDDFETLELEGHFNVTLIQGLVNEVAIHAPKKIQELIEISQTKNHLSVSLLEEERYFWTVNITITFVNLSEIESKIEGNLYSNGIIQLEELFLDVNAHGKTKLTLQVQKMDVDFSGEGKVLLFGSAKKANFNTRITGLFDASNFIVDYLNIDSSGKGDVRVNANINASANHIGNGWLQINGNATVDYCPLYISYGSL